MKRWFLVNLEIIGKIFVGILVTAFFVFLASFFASFASMGYDIKKQKVVCMNKCNPYAWKIIDDLCLCNSIGGWGEKK